MADKVLLVVDMLNDFINSDGALYCGKSAEKIVPYVSSLIKKIRKEKNEVIFISDSHRSADKEFEVFPPHCVKGTHGAEIIQELKADIELDYFIQKTRYSGFYKTKLEDLLNQLAPNEVHVAGVCTSICVMDTVSGLRNRDYKVIVHKKGVADFDVEAHEFSLKRMKKILGAEIL